MLPEFMFPEFMVSGFTLPELVLPEFILPEVMLSEDKYAPGDTSRWKHVSARSPALYQALLDEPDQTVRKSVYRIAVKRAG